MRQQLIARGDLHAGQDPDRPMITHGMPLAEINNAFELMKRVDPRRGDVLG
jgi:Zn-dependent alcohol dehydrogenase